MPRPGTPRGAARTRSPSLSPAGASTRPGAAPSLSVVPEQEGKGEKPSRGARPRWGVEWRGHARGLQGGAETPDPRPRDPATPQPRAAGALPARSRLEAAPGAGSARGSRHSKPDPEPHPGAEATPGLSPPLRPLAHTRPRLRLRGAGAGAGPGPGGGAARAGWGLRRSFEAGLDGAWRRGLRQQRGWAGLEAESGTGRGLRRSCEARWGGA